jgi:hypothetical protein
MTAWALYCAGSDGLRTFVAGLRIATGIALPVLVATHVARGRRTTKRVYP